jgi:hypothetical protein|tara:strand:+ start:25 stop:285 length:261 start_codon:yes stop_codon:yes gene_type:complete
MAIVYNVKCKKRFNAFLHRVMGYGLLRDKLNKMENIKVLREKEVKTIKCHECWKCRKIKKKGTNMVFNTIIFDERITNTYQCLVCT